MSHPSDSPSFRGLLWRAVVNGKNTLNGERHSVTMAGTVDDHPEGTTIYDVIRAMADQIENQNEPMAYPDSFQITLYPRPAETPKKDQRPSA